MMDRVTAVLYVIIGRHAGRSPEPGSPANNRSGHVIRQQDLQPPGTYVSDVSANTQYGSVPHGITRPGPGNNATEKCIWSES